jgi:ABC-type uncharacterized transport system permease subunit
LNMFDLPIHEMVVFALVVVVYAAASTAAVLQLLADGQRYRRFVIPLVALGAVLEAVVLIFRAVAIKAVPLTGTFESLIVLTIVFALVYLFFSIAIHRVWFGSVMVWVILGLIILSALVAEPASAAHAAASTPWAIAHGIAMILAGAAAMLAAASAVLYLFARRKLKQKKVLQVLGKVPNIERLERMNIFGLKACFVLMTLGFASGAGLAATASVNMTAADWLTDAKIVLIAVVWLLLGAILVLWRTVGLREKAIAYVTIVVFALILFAVVGTSVFCGTGHDFRRSDVETTEQAR